MQVRASTIALLLALAAAVPATDGPARAEEKPAVDREAAAKAMLRPICADPAARDKLVAEMIKRGGEYERATAKWDLDIACEQIDLPANPVHDTADSSDGASHTNWIYDARWSPDGRLIATAGRDGSVRLWDVATGKTVRKIDIKGPVRAARFLGDGRSLVVAADAQPVRIFDVKSGERVAEVPYSQPDPKSEMPPFMATTAAGLVVLGGYGGDLVVHDTKAKAARYRLPAIANHFPLFAVSETAGLLATTTPGGDRSVLVQLRRLETAEAVWETEAEGDRAAYSMAFSRDGKQLAVAVRGQVYIHATADRQLIRKVSVYPTFGSFEVAFTADGQKLIIGQRHAQLWDIATGKRVHHFGPFSDLCHSLDVSPDGRYLATGHIGSDGRIWEIATGTFHRRLGKNVRPPG